MLRAAGRLAFVCWRSLEDNELDVLPLRAAGLEDRLDPTPFSFADPGRIQATLHTAGFRDVAIEAHDERVSSGDLAAMITVLLKVGRWARSFAKTRTCGQRLSPRLRAALAARGDSAAVALNAATWVVTARV